MERPELILALDVDPEKARDTVEELAPWISIFKIGSRLFTGMGPEIIKFIRLKDRKVFLDLKFHDIPNTVAWACRNAVRMDVWGLTIHTFGGFAMMSEALKAAGEEAQILRKPRPLIFGVTVLTSMSEGDLTELGISRNAEEQVLHLAQLAEQAGLDGVVASGQELKMLRDKCGERFQIAVPGIRAAASEKGDQKRTLSAGEAVRAGADYLIVGRPILDSKNRIEAAQEIIREVGTK